MNTNMKNRGMTLLELLIASTIAGIVFSLGFMMVNQLSFQQTKVELAQRFYNESRILMDRISVSSRNHMIDYDRYWRESPTTTANTCFAILQGYANFFGEDNADILYPDNFYVDAQSLGETGLPILDTLKGGVDDVGNPKPCTQAIDGVQDQLYLINSQRTQRVTISFNATNNTIELTQELGADTNNDGIADLWKDTATFDASEDLCKIDDGSGNLKVVKGDASSESFCRFAHTLTSITPDFIEITDLKFLISPDRDPYLAYEVPGIRIQPHVLIKMESQFRDALSRGYSPDQIPSLRLQTSNSSRVYGNTRPPHDIYRLCDNPGCE